MMREDYLLYHREVSLGGTDIGLEWCGTLRKKGMFLVQLNYKEEPMVVEGKFYRFNNRNQFETLPKDIYNLLFNDEFHYVKEAKFIREIANDICNTIAISLERSGKKYLAKRVRNMRSIDEIVELCTKIE